eukprot:scaffold1124_cov361-Prasinococcus_capsulatus_cf.AAC.5
MRTAAAAAAAALRPAPRVSYQAAPGPVGHVGVDRDVLEKALLAARHRRPHERRAVHLPCSHASQVQTPLAR